MCRDVSFSRWSSEQWEHSIGRDPEAGTRPLMCAFMPSVHLWEAPSQLRTAGPGTPVETWRRAQQRPERFCLQWMLPGYHRSLFTPGAWDFPNSEEKRECLGANSLNCRPSVATELILWFPQCWKGNPNNSAYYQNFKLEFPNNPQRKILKNDLNYSLVPSQAPHF